MAVLSVSGLSKTYHKGLRREQTVALRDVSLSVEAGQLFGLLGPNGAGKTTLIKCVLDLVRPDAGVISLLDRPVRSPAARARLGYLPEDHHLPGYLNAPQTLDFVGQLFGLPADERRRRADRLLELVDLAKRRKDKVRTYSKGMRQRLGLAQALVNEPRVLILDEPNEGLDPLGRADVKELLKRLKGEGVTVFISSHVLTEIEHLCDRVAILNEGRLLKEGTVVELTEDGDLEGAFIELVRSTRALEGGA